MPSGIITILGRLPHRGACVLLAEMGLEPTLPVRVAESDGRGRDQQLAGDVEIVRDAVGREMGEIPKTEAPQSVALGPIEDLPADVPRVAVSADGRVLLRDRRVGGDVSVQEVVGVRAQQIRDLPGEL